MDLQTLRRSYLPLLPSLLKDLCALSLVKGEASAPAKDGDQLRTLFPKTFGQPLVQGKKGGSRKGKPLRLGVVFSGGQAAGGHNVISGLFDALHLLNEESRLFGFLGGPNGIIAGKYKEITAELLQPFRNQGGFDLLGSGRTKIESEEQLQGSLAALQKLQLDGLVIIGGDDSNTNAAVLAEYFLNKGSPIKVIGVPKTIDGDLRNAHLQISFGFDTACKVYAELIGNIARDALSARKYTHFIKLMGRSASHIALECALATHPNAALIGEEIAVKKKTLQEIAQELSEIICKRSEQGKDYSIFLIPEGVIEFIPEVAALMKALNALLLTTPSLQIEEVEKKLSPENAACFRSFPESIQEQLLLDRDPHGNINVSAVETERLLIEMVKRELEERRKKGMYKGKFHPLPHFFGYEGRAGFPSNFDTHLCYALGHVAALLIDEGLTGYMASIGNLTGSINEWTISGIPLTMLMNIEMRKGAPKPVVQKAFVDLKGRPFTLFQQQRERWMLQDDYQFPGPIQFFGPSELTEKVPFTI